MNNTLETTTTYLVKNIAQTFEYAAQARRIEYRGGTPFIPFEQLINQCKDSMKGIDQEFFYKYLPDFVEMDKAAQKGHVEKVQALRAEAGLN